MSYDASEARDQTGKWTKGGNHLARNQRRRAKEKAKLGTPEQRKGHASELRTMRGIVKDREGRKILRQRAQDVKRRWKSEASGTGKGGGKARRGAEAHAEEVAARRADRRHGARAARSEAHAEQRDEHQQARRDHAESIREERQGQREEHHAEARSLSREHAAESRGLARRHAREMAKSKAPDATGARHAAEKADLDHEHREARRALSREHRAARSDARAGHLDSIDALRGEHRSERISAARDDAQARRGATSHGLKLSDRPTPERLDRLGTQAKALGKTLGNDWSLTHGPARNASESREGQRAARRGGFLVIKTVKPIRAEHADGEARTHHLVGGERVATTAAELGGNHVSIQRHATVTTADNGAQIHGYKKVITAHATHEEALAASRAHAEAEADRRSHQAAYATRDLRKYLSREHRDSFAETGNHTRYRIVTSG